MARSFMGAFVCLFLAALSFSVQAMECHLGDAGGTTTDTEEFGNLKIPSDAPLHSRLWTSKQITRTVFCWSEVGFNDGEHIYLYPNPDRIEPPWGISFGLIYNGVDRGKFGENEKFDTNITSYPLSMKPEKFTLSYQIYMERTGTITGMLAWPVNMPVFQLDGQQDLNSNRGRNYRYIMKGQLDVIFCSIRLTLPPSINFGPVATWEGVGNGATVARQSFSIGVHKDYCRFGPNSKYSQFALSAIFDTRTSDASLPNRTQPPGTISTMMDLGNGLGMTLQDPNGAPVSFNTPQYLVNMTGITDTTRRYTATLVAKGEAKEGAFNRPLILLINYL